MSPQAPEEANEMERKGLILEKIIQRKREQVNEI